ncbi:MAG: cadmium-translocating P-type ATPase [Gemmatimonadetes bacterium]|nr:cadmium-translocating P-type ATPase [Gemmatimonadota bacterium]MBK7716139.1 cadmium-translocating P-type ATPase [Gemmatimonadota bacterium]
MTGKASARPSPWKTPFARRAYVACLLLSAGALVSLWTGTPDQAGWLRLRLDLPGLFYLAACAVGGSNFFGAGFRAIRTFRLDMNFLMSAAIIAAVLIGESFEAATLAALFSLAELLERFAVDRGRRSIARLLELAPEVAERLEPDGASASVPVEVLRVGDRVRIRPGAKIPADGRVVGGASSVNQAMVTGESLPVTKHPGDSVLAGTLNAEGALEVEVTADAAHSALARIVQLVKEAETRRAPIEEFVKRFARVYTPVVTGLAVIVMVAPPALGLGAGLDWFVRGLTLLVIACPCALVIATPVTVVSAITSGARHGVLIKGGSHLETLGQVRSLAIDKTGTLTFGRLVVTEFRAEPAVTRDTLLRQLLAVEQLSEHPVAAAVVTYALGAGATAGAVAEQFAAIPGKGLEARFEGRRILVGTEELVGAEVAGRWGPTPAGSIRTFIHTDTAAGMIEMRDQLRDNAARVVERLHRLGVQPVVMLTGDAEAAAREIGRLTGVDEVRFRLSPEDKVAAVRELRARYGTVAMMGDGVNDAPALAEANVGLAMGAAGSPAAIEAADIALLADDLGKLPYAVHLARRARRTIRLNIGIALGLKTLLAVGALLGLVSLPIAVVVGDMGGSLVVTLNALRVAATRDAA